MPHLNFDLFKNKETIPCNQVQPMTPGGLSFFILWIWQNWYQRGFTWFHFSML